MAAFESGLIVVSALLLISVVTSKAASRLGIPSLLLFLAIGIAAGPHGMGHVVFPGGTLARELGIFALAFILFSGGIDTEIPAVRPVLGPALVLSTLGVLIVCALVGAFAHLVVGFSWLEGGLLGATVASTDVAAVFNAMRAKNMSLKAGLAPLLELESALNDPVAVVLGVALLGWVGASPPSAGGLILFFLRQFAIGLAMGWLSGRLQIQLINRIKLEYEGLYPVLTLGCAMLTYALTQKIGGSGFLAVYLAGMILGNGNVLHRRSLIHFHEGIAWLGQIGMFLAMGLLVDPRELVAIAPFGFALSLFLVFIARPASVFICLVGSRFGGREKLMLSWGGLRGAVPIILASYVLAARIPGASGIFNLVFFVTFLSVLLQGTTLPLVARSLRVDVPERAKFRFPLELNPTRNVRSKLLEVSVPQGSSARGKSLIELNLPRDVLVILIQRHEELLVPRGGTQIEERDTLLVLSESETKAEIENLLR